MVLTTEQKIKVLIKEALEKAGIGFDEEIQLEHPGEEEHGDYSTNVAMQIFKGQRTENRKQIADKSEDRKSDSDSLSNPVSRHQSSVVSHPSSDRALFKNPRELAQLVVDNFPKSDLIEKVEVAGPGFINIWLNKEYLINETVNIVDQKDNYGLNPAGFLKGKKYMVEFAHPNTHKMFHIGHLRNATTGETLVRILEANGAKIIRANYEGDVGLHIAKCLYSIVTGYGLRVTGSMELVKSLEEEYKTIKDRVEFLGKMYSEGNKAYETDEKAKVEILRINKLIYAKDPEIYDLWKVTRQWSLDYFESIYKRLSTHFDRYYFESECYERGKELVMKGLGKGVFEKSEGAIVFSGEKYGLHKRVFVTSEGNTTYEGKDMALGELQFKEYNPDLIIHCVGPEQAEYFKVIFEALGLLFPGMKEKEKHIPYGWVKLKEGKMSSREGNVVLGEWLLDEAKDRVINIMKNVETQNIASLPMDEISEKVAVGAVKYSFLKVSLPSEIAFDFTESINFEGDSGPYLQYTYARTRSVNRKATNYSSSERSESRSMKLFSTSSNNKIEPEELSLLRFLNRFPEVVFEAGQSYAPNLICKYLFELAQKYNLFYNKLSILKAEKEDLANFRLMLNEAVGIVLKNGLKLLGIEVVEKM